MKRMFPMMITWLCSAIALLGEPIKVPEHHQSIQAAIDVAESGDTIEVAPGTYRERLVLQPGIAIRSVGPDGKGKLGLARAEATIIDGGGEDGRSPGVTMAEGATLDGFTITRVGIYDADRWKKDWEEKGDNQEHEDIGNFGVPAIAITGSTCTVINNIVRHNGETGIAIRGAEDKRCAPLVSDNICYRNMGGGIGSMKDSTALIDSNTCFENLYAGIGHNGASPVVTRNVCHNNVRAGIGVSEGASPVVRKNRCYGNRRAGIGIRTGGDTRPVVEDNDCYENEMAGIGAEDEAAPIIRSNRCYRNKLAGIGCREGSSPLITDNHCFENKAAGIGVNSANPLILRNRLEKNETAGIGIRGDTKARLLENTCLENRLVAVGIPDGAEAFLYDNVLVRTGGMPPIIAILGGSKATLIDNTIKGGGVAGILLEGSLHATGNVIEGQKGRSGILARKNSEATLTGNRIGGYRTRLSDQGAKSIISNDESEKLSKDEREAEAGTEKPPTGEKERFKVIGYLPSWSGDVEKLQYDKLTHINYSFILPRSDGTLNDLPRPAKLRELVKLAHENQVKVGLAIGGWNGGDDSAFETLSASPETRKRFVTETMKMVKAFNLDGVDMDWEYPDEGASSENFLSLMRELSTELRGKNKFLSTAVVSNGKTGAGIKEDVFPLIDMLNVMAYDGSAHGLYSQAEASIRYWSERGCPKEKLILGLPFYGRSPYRSYRDLVVEDPTAPTKDVLKEIRYNGIATMRRKTQLGIERCGGVMIWELSQDVEGENSLLGAISEVIAEKARLPSRNEPSGDFTEQRN